MKLVPDKVWENVPDPPEILSTGQPAITGYRNLSPEEVALMNGIKASGNDLGAMIESLEKIPTIDKRWLAIAKTDLQKGFMSLTRAVAQPTSF